MDEAYQKALDTLGESRSGYYLVIELADTKEPVGSACMFPDAEKNRIFGGLYENILIQSMAMHMGDPANTFRGSCIFRAS